MRRDGRGAAANGKKVEWRKIGAYNAKQKRVSNGNTTVKTSALRVRIEPELHKQFLETCKARDIPASQVLREFMRQYVSTHDRSAQLDFFRAPDGQDGVE